MSTEKHWILTDRLKRKYFVKTYITRLIYKSFIVNSSVPKILKIYAKIKNSKFHRFSSAGIYNNRCLVTGRSYGVLSNFKKSRFVVRRLSHLGMISGVKRSSW